jgi:hypothetical protein
MNNMSSSYYYRSAYMTIAGKFITLKNKITGTDSTLETWTYDPESNTWENVVTTSRPPYRGCNYGLAYDSWNGVAMLVAGQKVWNGTPVNDLWIYHPVEKSWEEMKPAPVAGFPIANGYALTTAYDSRHNAFIMTAGPWSGTHYPVMAYRYKKTTTQAEQGSAGAGLPPMLTLSPNPFNPVTLLQLPKSERIGRTLRIHSIDGRLVADLSREAGRSDRVRFDARRLPSGIYFVTLTGQGGTLTAKCILMK